MVIKSYHRDYIRKNETDIKHMSEIAQITAIIGLRKF